MKLRTLLMGAIASTAFAPMVMADGHEGERGRDGEVKIIYWQAPSILNPYLSGGTKDLESASLVLEPMGRYDETGALVPYLAAEIPTVENGGVSEDLTSITWKIADGMQWSDGTPVTSADLVFTAEYCMHPEGGCAQASKFDGVSSVEAIDDMTVKVTFSEAKPNPYGPFMGAQSPILQKAQFADCLGAKAPECTEANFNPIGTGPFTVTEFRPNDVITMAANENFRHEGKPAFASLTFKGGGDAVAAGRAVMETGEFDYAWNMQLAPDVLAKMAEAGKGTPISAFGTLVERIEMNMTNPSPDLPEGERSTVAHPHPILSDFNVRKALSMAIDRPLLVEVGYGQAGRPTCNLVPAPALYASDNTECLTQDIEGAKALLEEAGWTDTDGDGVREKDGMKLSLLYQTSTNAVRQDFQALIKDWWSQIGVETELRNLDASVFFGGDPGSPDTFQKFYADVEMYANNFDGTDPQAYLSAYRCGNEPKPSSQWQGENINRFCNEEYDTLLDELSRTGELDKRGEIAKRLNEIITKDTMTIVPLVDRGRVSAASNTLGGVILNTWDSELWNVADWYRMK
ncbi:Peptide/opine/nickel uptake family protein ABC transporter, periplasmic substrate-binding protein [Sulfitobacter noctilucicola]|uniref:Peptide/nickel transport system substrate-binding protein n=1 Tax=Sulfitobacter noctilucicola TaxID=1342301 RepID=A0A7W6M866_9RHOB|nr:peptide ABC transporter substrate-binding protein [Sulfitobacter noctilucicola]KIN64639.1 Peptide/opine/nickel uptake family protein ABC transporter, periplasmic substrate-binding protein [Sulfitobacter noctilucicola]MBB4174210.1 peptide/nickel transport system substrate-binding protein [Sulfitobacter noctilucicola]